MSPEQAAGQSSRCPVRPLCGRSVGYEMLSGKPPFTGPTPQAILASQVTRTACRSSRPSPMCRQSWPNIMRCPGEGAGESLDISRRDAIPAGQLSALRTGRTGSRFWPGGRAAANGCGRWFGPGEALSGASLGTGTSDSPDDGLSEAGDNEQTYAVARRVEEVAPEIRCSTPCGPALPGR